MLGSPPFFCLRLLLGDPSSRNSPPPSAKSLLSCWFFTRDHGSLQNGLCDLGGFGMTRSRTAILIGVALACLALPTKARAQSAFAGVVKDATGAVLPGVTVEAASPALIEKVRSATTDSNGAYKIENLRPGT